MSEMIQIQKKGLDACWIDSSLDPDKLHLHITEVPPASRPHPPHIHSGIETFYILEGSGVIETPEGNVPVQPNQAVILDASQEHGLVNTGSVPMKYIVIISR